MTDDDPTLNPSPSPAVPSRDDTPAPQPIRWWIAAMLTIATALNYLDRQTLPILVNSLEGIEVISPEEYGSLNFWFLLAYGSMYAIGGKIIDILGTRTGYTLMILWWSAATFLQGTVSSVLGLGIFRFLLGMGEGGAFPGSAKAVSEWFPVRERSFAFGIFNTGSAVGAILAPSLVALIVYWLDWRWVFYLTGSVGFIWAGFWLLIYPRHAAVPETVSPASLPPAERVESSIWRRWLELLAYRQVWGLVAARFLSDSAWYFFIFWLPKYLQDARKLTLSQVGYSAWIPWVAAGIGSFGIGWFSSWLLKQGMTIDRSRKIALGVSALLLPASLFITASPLSWALLLFSLAYLGHQSWSTILQTLPADLFAPQQVGSAAGLLGAAGAFGAMFFSLIAGNMIGSVGYEPVFFVAGLLHPISFVIILLTVPRVQRIG